MLIIMSLLLNIVLICFQLMMILIDYEIMVLTDYDFNTLYNNNIIEDFFNSCNIEYQLEDTHKYKEINTGQTLKTAYAMVAINKGIVRCNIDRGKLYNATNICFALSDKSDRRAQALTNSERLDLLNRCKESNDNISKHFFNNVDFFDSNIDIAYVKCYGKYDRYEY